MKNKIVFLGTAGDSLTLAKQRRKGGGFLLRLEGGQYHIDPGPGALSAAAAAGISPRETICVVASNNSLLASGGVNEVIDAMTLGGVDRFGVVVCSDSVANGTNDEQPILLRRTVSWVERVVTFEETTRIGINYLNIFPKRATGADKTGLGFLFESPNFSIGYTSDTGYSEWVADQYKNVDIMIINCRHPRGVDEKGYLNIGDVEKFLLKVKPRVAFLTAFGGRLLDGDTIALARELQRETKVQVVAAKDGLEVDLNQFAGKRSQQTLKGYEKK